MVAADFAVAEQPQDAALHPRRFDVTGERGCQAGQFVADVTFFVWTAIIIGGIGNNRGALLGGLLFIILHDALRFLPMGNDMAVTASSIRTALVGVVLILVLRWRPEGILAERPARLSVRRPGRPARMGAKAADA